MSPKNMKKATLKTQLLPALVVAVTLFLAPVAFAATPGITGGASTPTFNLTAQQAYLNMPDGEAVYSWGYGCNGTPAGFLPSAISGATCGTMQVPGPTLIVHENDVVTVNLQNGLPSAAGNTSILFPGFNVSTSCTATTPVGQQGLLTCEATPGASVTYTFTASAPGTHPYYSGTQGDLQVEMGLYGAVIVLPANVPGNCTAGYHALNQTAQANWGEADFRLSQAAYDHPGTCYDREYLFQWAEMDHRIHRQAEAQALAKVGCTAGAPGCSLDVQTEPYHPAYFLINGRSMPDLMDPNYASEYPHQPYNGNPHMHPGELTLIRTIGQGRWQHPFHEHANHVRILARDGNLVLSSSTTKVTYTSGLSTDSPVAAPGLAGLLMFNTDTTPGESFDGIFYFTGRGLNWDPFGHHPPGAGATTPSSLSITGLSEVSTTVTATVTNTVPNYLAGQQVTIASAALGPFTITAISESGNTVTATVSGVLPASGITTVNIGGVANGHNGTFTLTNVTPGTTTSTLTYTDPTTGMTPGTAGTAIFPVPGYNGSVTITAVNPPNSFTYTAPAGLLSANSGTVTFSSTIGATNENPFPNDPLASLPCTPDVNGYNSGAPTAVNFMEWCQDHNKPVQVAPFGDVAGGGPVTLPDPNVFTNGAWYGGTPYFGPDASLRASMPACSTTTNANCTTLQPANLQVNPPNERGWAFMWHSHNEREITTNNVFPGGMLMMMLVDSREFVIDESK